jgi:hypothetical protein
VPGSATACKVGLNKGRTLMRLPLFLFELKMYGFRSPKDNVAGVIGAIERAHILQCRAPANPPVRNPSSKTEPVGSQPISK